MPVLACTSVPLTSSLASFTYGLPLVYLMVYLVFTCMFTSCLPVIVPRLPHVYLLLLTYRSDDKAEEGEEGDSEQQKKQTPKKKAQKKSKPAAAAGDASSSGEAPSSGQVVELESSGAPSSGKQPLSGKGKSDAASSARGAASKAKGKRPISSKSALLVHLRHVFTSCLPLLYL